MNFLSNFGNEWCTFDKQNGCSNLKALFDNCILSVLCAWKDSQNLMKLPNFFGRSRSLINKYNYKKNLKLNKDNT
jgi:hypothetical protein